MANVKKLFTGDPWKTAVKQPKSKDWTEVVANTTIDVCSGVAGGLGGSFLGWFAIPAGITLSAVGHSTGHRWLSTLGIGIIAAPLDVNKGRKAEGAPFSLKDEFEAGKERSKEYIKMLKEKFLINKIMGNKQSGQSSESGDEQTVSGLDPNIPIATLDKLTEFDEQIVSEGIEYQSKYGSTINNGAAFPVNGIHYELDELPHII